MVNIVTAFYSPGHSSHIVLVASTPGGGKHNLPCSPSLVVGKSFEMATGQHRHWRDELLPVSGRLALYGVNSDMKFVQPVMLQRSTVI